MNIQCVNKHRSATRRYPRGISARSTSREVCYPATCQLVDPHFIYLIYLRPVVEPHQLVHYTSPLHPNPGPTPTALLGGDRISALHISISASRISANFTDHSSAAARDFALMSSSSCSRSLLVWIR